MENEKPKSDPQNNSSKNPSRRRNPRKRRPQQGKKESVPPQKDSPKSEPVRQEKQVATAESAGNPPGQKKKSRKPRNRRRKPASPPTGKPEASPSPSQGSPEIASDSKSNRSRKPRGRPEKKVEKVPDGFEVGKAVETQNWLQDDFDRYYRAVCAAVKKAPISEEGILKMSEVWVNTSLPLDLIVEVIQSKGLEEEIPVKKVLLEGKTIWERKPQEPSSEIDLVSG
ncbi:MAG TPA: hypothetical protein PLF96_01905 [Thermotogota bacterium]|nr:hypothetical protein [Thermotogota bacterium]